MRVWPCAGRPREFLGVGLVRSPARYYLIGRGDEIELVDALAGQVVYERVAALKIERYDDEARVARR
jgi:hypothetical protein